MRLRRARSRSPQPAGHLRRERIHRHQPTRRDARVARLPHQRSSRACHSSAFSWRDTARSTSRSFSSSTSALFPASMSLEISLRCRFSTAFASNLSNLRSSRFRPSTATTVSTPRARTRQPDSAHPCRGPGRFQARQATSIPRQVADAIESTLLGGVTIGGRIVPPSESKLLAALRLLRTHYRGGHPSLPIHTQAVEIEFLKKGSKSAPWPKSKATSVIAGLRAHLGSTSSGRSCPECSRSGSGTRA